jgi:hypothetical protein
VVVVTDVFENLARTAARARGFHDLHVHVLPHPLEARPESEIRDIARAHFATLIAALTGDA